MMNRDYEWLVDRLIDYEHVEEGPELEKQECQEILDLISEKTGKSYLLIVNINIEVDGIYYDYILDKNDTNKVIIEEWDNRYL